MVRQHGYSFGALVKRYRGRAGLTQEALAEAAGLSVRGLSDLERGVSNAPRAATVQWLADALLLAENERAVFEALARRQAAAALSTETSSAAASLNNVPLALTSFVGREDDLSTVQALLRGNRLVTLTGTGGIGKTRLALQLASEMLTEFPDGIWLVELAGLSDSELVPRAAAAVFNVREEPEQDTVTALIEHLRDRHLLILLDNCEHLVYACANLATSLLQLCPSIRVLATSREGLAVAGETQYRVPSLATPDPTCLPTLHEMCVYPAVRLLVERAQARRPDFGITARTAHAAAQICARLDGIPLALELAGAQLSVLAVEGVAARLDDRFQLLVGGSRIAPPRQKTLRAAIDWSYELLTHKERTAFRRLSVFVGGWTLEAAEAVCTYEEVTSGDVLALLGSLAEKSLVSVEERDGVMRYRLLETIRLYAREHLVASGEEAIVQGRRRDWCITLADRGATAVGAGIETWMKQMDAELDNLREVLRWTISDPGGFDAAAQLIEGLGRFWPRRGLLKESRFWLEQILNHWMELTDGQRAQVCMSLGDLTYSEGNYKESVEHFSDAVAMFRRQGDTCRLAAALREQGVAARWLGDFDRAAACFDECLTLYRDLKDRPRVAGTLYNMARLAAMGGDREKARLLMDECLGQVRLLEDQSHVAGLLGDLGIVARELGDYDQAAMFQEESLALSRDVGNKFYEANGLRLLGLVARERGDYNQATTYYKKSLLILSELGYKNGIAASLEGLALARARQGTSHVAAQLLGAAEGLRDRIGSALLPTDRTAHDEALAQLKAALGGAAFSETYAAGQALSLDQAIDLALNQLSSA
jgi:predicted ATPase/DNA-binding XRE family transcriptional regulator